MYRFVQLSLQQVGDVQDVKVELPAALGENHSTRAFPFFQQIYLWQHGFPSRKKWT